MIFRGESAGRGRGQLNFPHTADGALVAQAQGCQHAGAAPVARLAELAVDRVAQRLPQRIHARRRGGQALLSLAATARGGGQVLFEHPKRLVEALRIQQPVRAAQLERQLPALSGARRFRHLVAGQQQPRRRPGSDRGGIGGKDEAPALGAAQAGGALRQAGDAAGDHHDLALARRRQHLGQARRGAVGGQARTRQRREQRPREPMARPSRSRSRSWW